MSPNVSLVHDDVANKQIVNKDDKITAKFLFPITFPFS